MSFRLGGMKKGDRLKFPVHLKQIHVNKQDDSEYPGAGEFTRIEGY